MSLKDILTKLAEETESFFLYNANGSHSPASLLNEPARIVYRRNQ